jgi:hypothetical protein
LLGRSSGLPGSRWRAGSAREIEPPSESAVRVLCFLFDLAPGGVCLAKPVARPAGELLPHRFTLAARLRRDARRFAFCCTFPGLAAGGCCPSPCPAVPGLSSDLLPKVGRYVGPRQKPAAVRSAPNESELYNNLSNYSIEPSGAMENIARSGQQHELRLDHFITGLMADGGLVSGSQRRRAPAAGGVQGD